MLSNLNSPTGIPKKMDPIKHNTTPIQTDQ
ncbi:uncharacterized protein METZ01_LOCUS29291 [marine metagenome]|uniref:Uncharacterized protein n=1 Tax=marine metagenome TaxID=408172 RepID=A0A381QEE4_9ZZZZ